MLGEARQNLTVLTMQQALKNHDQFDVCVIDEADQCLLEKGVYTADNLQHVSGFWNMLLKRAVLMTATAGENFADMLFDIIGVKLSDFLTFDELLTSADSNSCK